MDTAFDLELRQDFLVEAGELLQRLGEQLVALERDHNRLDAFDGACGRRRPDDNPFAFPNRKSGVHFSGNALITGRPRTAARERSAAVVCDDTAVASYTAGHTLMCRSRWRLSGHPRTGGMEFRVLGTLEIRGGGRRPSRSDAKRP